MASQITILTIVYSSVFNHAQIKENIKGPVTRKIFPMMTSSCMPLQWQCLDSLLLNDECIMCSYQPHTETIHLMHSVHINSATVSANLTQEHPDNSGPIFHQDKCTFNLHNFHPYDAPWGIRVTRYLPFVRAIQRSQRYNDANSVSVSWRYHGKLGLFRYPVEECFYRNISRSIGAVRFLFTYPIAPAQAPGHPIYVKAV